MWVGLYARHPLPLRPSSPSKRAPPSERGSGFTPDNRCPSVRPVPVSAPPPSERGSGFTPDNPCLSARPAPVNAPPPSECGSGFTPDNPCPSVRPAPVSAPPPSECGSGFTPDNPCLSVWVARDAEQLVVLISLKAGEVWRRWNLPPRVRATQTRRPTRQFPVAALEANAESVVALPLRLQQGALLDDAQPCPSVRTSPPHRSPLTASPPHRPSP